MKIVRLKSEIDFEGFRRVARAAAASRVGTDAIRFVTGSADNESDLFSEHEAPEVSTTGAPLRVPPRFIRLADLVCRHKEPTRYDLLYAALLRLRETPRFLEIASDPLVRRLEDMKRAVRRDRHKMTAFVRFREINAPDGARFVAWFEPSHYIEELAAPFFVDRFASMQFAILTPRTSILWDGALRFGAGARREDAPPLDDFAGAWDVYYRSIFNPARLMKRAMLKEMPKKYWANLPETRQIAAMSSAAHLREDQMVAARPSEVEPGTVKVAARFAEARKPRAPADAYESLLSARRKLVASVRLAIVRRRRFSAKVRHGRAQSLLASSRGIRRICKGDPSSDRRACCCAQRYATRASQRASAISQTRSSISSSSRAENDASTRRRVRARSITAAGGWTVNSPWWNRRSSSRWAPARFALWPDHRRGLPTCADGQSRSARGRCCRRSIPPICFGYQTQMRKRLRPAPSPTTSSKQLSLPREARGRMTIDRSR